MKYVTKPVRVMALRFDERQVQPMLDFVALGGLVAEVKADERALKLRVSDHIDYNVVPHGDWVVIYSGSERWAVMGDEQFQQNHTAVEEE